VANRKKSTDIDGSGSPAKKTTTAPSLRNSSTRKATEALSTHLYFQALSLSLDLADTSGNSKCDLVVDAALENIAPVDCLESMLVTQMIGLHEMAIRLMKRYEANNRTGHSPSELDLAAKLMRTFAGHVETLNRHRGKGQQKVTVEHVTVNQGGQAIVGNVNAQGRRGDE
jgi:hypothetical protein